MYLTPNAPTTLRINPAEQRHVNAVMAANHAHQLPLDDVKVLCLSLNAQNPSLQEETAAYLHLETGRRQQATLPLNGLEPSALRINR